MASPFNFEFSWAIACSREHEERWAKANVEPTEPGERGAAAARALWNVTNQFIFVIVMGGLLLPPILLPVWLRVLILII